MANMSYCRFRNTSSDLEDCVNAVEVMQVKNGKYLDAYSDEISWEELIACKAMRDQCERFIEAFDDLFNN